MIGQVLLHKYRVISQLDEGGMSKIYLARQLDPLREVVVKVLKESLRSQSKNLEHFKREIFIMTRFQHPNSVAVLDSDTRDPRGPFLVMEYLRGIDMNQLLQREGRLTPERTGRLLVQFCDGLQAAHDAGVVHRDLKPGNLMVLYNGTPQETLKLMDYGLAKMTSMLYISPEEVFDWSMPAASGTPEYISPEMVRGNDLDARGDLYSVGVVLYEMLTGRRPFLHQDVEALMLAHAHEPPPSFASIGVHDVSPAVEAVVMSCLAKYPYDRPKTAWDLALAYEKALGRRITQTRTMVQTTGSNQGLNPPGGTLPSKHPVPISRERQAIRHTVEATMPEVMALIKLKGFVADLGGEIIESEPGLIKVRLIEKPEAKSTGFLGWMSGGSKSRQVSVLQTAKGTDLELHMERRDPSQQNKLTITLVMKPSGGMATTEWKNRCGQISRDLQSYLMR